VAKKKKIPAIVKQIQKQPIREINYGYEKQISYSQFSMFLSCPHKWALQYRDGYYTSESSIHMTFGTALHEALQHYITVIYEESGAAADRIDLEAYFEERFRETYLKDYKSNKNVHFSNPSEMKEFFEDGLNILNYIKKKRGGYFGKRGWYLVGCELPLLTTPNPEYKNILYKGFLDVVLYNETLNRFKIIDIKTSTKGWDDKTKKDETKQMQLILYKKFFSQQFNIPEDNIDIEFFIVKRKVWEESPYPISRIQSFIPSSGKVKVNKSTKSINEFIETVFDKDNKLKPTQYTPVANKWNCSFCPFKNKKDLCPVGVSS
jgi:hypothetical protein